VVKKKKKGRKMEGAHRKGKTPMDERDGRKRGRLGVVEPLHGW